MDGGQHADGSVCSTAFEVVQAFVDEGGEALHDTTRIAVQIWADPPRGTTQGQELDGWSSAIDTARQRTSCRASLGPLVPYASAAFAQAVEQA